MKHHSNLWGSTKFLCSPPPEVLTVSYSVLFVCRMAQTRQMLNLPMDSPLRASQGRDNDVEWRYVMTSSNCYSVMCDSSWRFHPVIHSDAETRLFSVISHEAAFRWRFCHSLEDACLTCSGVVKCCIEYIPWMLKAQGYYKHISGTQLFIEDWQLSSVRAHLHTAMRQRRRSEWAAKPFATHR